MDFPAVEKWHSHISQRRPSEASTASSDSDSSPSSSTNSSPIAARPALFTLDSYDHGLTAQASNATARPQISRQVTITKTTTAGTTITLDPGFEIDFEADDPEDPRNWPLWYKAFVIFAISYGTLMVVLYSTSYTATFVDMSKEFNITSEAITTLGVTTYLFGLAVGSLLLAPISETYGRKPVYTYSMALFVILILPCALAKNIQTIIVTRFFGAVFGAAMIANAPGTVGDIINDKYRATAFSIWSIGPMNGPVIGPVIGGFVTEYKGWRWANWVVMIAGGAALGMMIIINETYAPALLQKKAKKMRKENDDERYWCRYDVKVGFLELMKVNLSRPFVMAVTEPICIFWNVYIAIIYGILYLCFVAYPIVFTELRGWSVGISGLAFLGIGIGTMITICAATPIRKMIEAHKPDPKSGQVPPEAMMSAVCIAAVLIPVGQIWFAWTCYPISIHWSISIAAGIPFGCGNGAVFIYASNYLVHSYGIYAASAMAGNAVMRSFMGGTLPLAGPAMYRALGPNWAGCLLGLLEVAIIPIPVVFYKYGHKIREKSSLIREMRENEERQERKRQRAQERMQRQLKLTESRNNGGKEKEMEAERELNRQLEGATAVDYGRNKETNV